jgi:ribosomal protein L37AE/L43A
MAEDKSQEHERDARKHGALSCPRCAKPTLYRVKRKGLLQRLLYPRFGYFPWKCKECNAVQLYKARGVRHRRAET